MLIHLRAHALAGGKEIFYHAYLPLYISIGNRLALLVHKREGSHMMIQVITDDRQRLLLLLVAYLIIIPQEANSQKHKKHQKKNARLTLFHGAKV